MLTNIFIYKHFLIYDLIMISQRKISVENSELH